MKYWIIVLLSLVTVTASAKKKTDFSTMTPREIVSNLEWTVSVPKVSSFGLEPLTEFVEAGDKLNFDIRKMVGDMTFYDVKMVVNEATGDTIVAVVDDEGHIRSKWDAFVQYTEMLSVGAVMADNAINILSKGKGLKDNWKGLVDTSDLARSVAMWKTLGTAAKQIGAMNVAVKDGILGNFRRQQNKIAKYIKASANIADLSDPTLRNLPGVELSTDDILLLSGENFTAELEEAKKKDEITMEGSDYQSIQAELDKIA